MSDVIIPLGSPGIAGYSAETYGGPAELFFSDTPPVATKHIRIAAPAGGLTLPLGAVIRETGALATITAGTAASGTFTVAAGNAANSDTLVIMGRTYTFRTTLSGGGLPNEILIGGNATQTAQNVVAAINGATGEGTLYGAGTTQNELVSATNSGGVVTLTARQVGTVGNAITLVATGANLSVSGATLTGGVNPTSTAFGILAAPISMLAGQVMSVPVHVAGHFNMLALTFHSDFSSDRLKERAFVGTESPGILISKPKHLDSHVNI
jgi:hypothetical protein